LQNLWGVTLTATGRIIKLKTFNETFLTQIVPVSREVNNGMAHSSGVKTPWQSDNGGFILMAGKKNKLCTFYSYLFLAVRSTLAAVSAACCSSSSSWFCWSVEPRTTRLSRRSFGEDGSLTKAETDWLQSRGLNRENFLATDGHG